MKGLGTIVNVLAVIVGSGIGIIIKNGMKQRFQDILMQACGIATIFIGAGGALCGLLSVTPSGQLETHNTMLLIFSMVLGGLIGEFFNIEQKMEQMGITLKGLIGSGNSSDSRFVDGFVTSSLVICVGAMAIVGSIQDGLTGDYTMLFSKAILDFIIVMVFASTFGIGVAFSALPLGIYQGLITLFASLIASFFDDALIKNLSCIGSVLIFCVGINIAFDNKIKVGNLLPAIIIPVIYSFF
ncbi:DUF554 domain-containing protein [Clostridium sp. AM58-1XD]|uniref:DUF554 domain-containing protein n=1 Tax=Clostridium sp. AM58-1XD TaxID=2292307 RepID=UPI000E4F2E27|nr:DUF554 domain-containing protein [Clostridium sp. AM58-1XD]RGY99065.1 DUF554 domain-containing protein [Clostridium sp. AM58-1XD]